LYADVRVTIRNVISKNLRDQVYLNRGRRSIDINRAGRGKPAGCTETMTFDFNSAVIERESDRNSACARADHRILELNMIDIESCAAWYRRQLNPSNVGNVYSNFGNVYRHLPAAQTGTKGNDGIVGAEMIGTRVCVVVEPNLRPAKTRLQ